MLTTHQKKVVLNYGRYGRPVTRRYGQLGRVLYVYGTTVVCHECHDAK